MNRQTTRAHAGGRTSEHRTARNYFAWASLTMPVFLVFATTPLRWLLLVALLSLAAGLWHGYRGARRRH